MLPCRWLQSQILRDSHARTERSRTQPGKAHRRCAPQNAYGALSGFGRRHGWRTPACDKST
eukprot:scaffold347_cov239-Pinguiococcus_pyrenoidosus.AAC.5